MPIIGSNLADEYLPPGTWNGNVFTPTDPNAFKDIGWNQKIIQGDNYRQVIGGDEADRWAANGGDAQFFDPRDHMSPEDRKQLERQEHWQNIRNSRYGYGTKGNNPYQLSQEYYDEQQRQAALRGGKQPPPTDGGARDFRGQPAAQQQSMQGPQAQVRPQGFGGGGGNDFGGQTPWNGQPSGDSSISMLSQGPRAGMGSAGSGMGQRGPGGLTDMNPYGGGAPQGGGMQSGGFGLPPGFGGQMQGMGGGPSAMQGGKANFTGGGQFSPPQGGWQTSAGFGGGGPGFQVGGGGQFAGGLGQFGATNGSPAMGGNPFANMMMQNQFGGMQGGPQTFGGMLPNGMGYANGMAPMGGGPTYTGPGASDANRTSSYAAGQAYENMGGNLGGNSEYMALKHGFGDRNSSFMGGGNGMGVQNWMLAGAPGAENQPWFPKFQQNFDQWRQNRLQYAGDANHQGQGFQPPPMPNWANQAQSGVAKDPKFYNDEGQLRQRWQGREKAMQAAQGRR